MMQGTPVRPVTGRKVTLWFVAFFGVVIVVNFLMARQATATFGGVVVENSYVASQNFNRWLDAAESQRGLGWSAEATRLPDGRIEVRFVGTGAAQLALAGVARHPLGRNRDRQLAFQPAGAARFVSRETLPKGRWHLRLKAAAGETNWRGELALQ